MARDRTPRRKGRQVDYVHLTHPFDPQSVFSDDAVAALHDAALGVLEREGMKVLLPEARGLFSVAGCRVTDDMVFIGRDIVEAALATTPRRFRLRSVNPRRERDYAPGQLLFGPGSGCPNATDLARGRRPGSLSDYEETLALQQSFDVIHILGPSVEPQDVPANLRHYALMRAQITRADKPMFIYARGRRQIEESLQMIRLGLGLSDADWATGVWAYTVINTNSPRQLDNPMAQGIIDFARAGQASIITPFCLAGAMAPVTVAGALILQHAEALAGITLAQLARAGAPVSYGGFSSNVDMKSGAPAFGTPEHLKMQIGSGQLARHIGMPWRSASGAASNAADMQAAQETTHTLWGALMAQATLIVHAAGWLEGGLPLAMRNSSMTSRRCKPWPRCASGRGRTLRISRWMPWPRCRRADISSARPIRWSAMTGRSIPRWSPICRTLASGAKVAPCRRTSGRRQYGSAFWPISSPPPIAPGQARFWRSSSPTERLQAGPRRWTDRFPRRGSCANQQGPLCRRKMPQPHTKPRVVVMNDTSGRSHHGCSRVMRLLLQGLDRHGMEVTFRSPARHDWGKDAAFLAALDRADLVVINGEGTLHHGRAEGERLLQVIPLAKAKGVPVALINALWQENPASWSDLLSGAALIATRDGRSAAQIAQSLGANVRVLPDLSLSAGAEPQPGPRDRLYFGDSVRWSTRRALALAAGRLGADALLPTKTRTSALWSHWPSAPLLSALYHGVGWGLPPLRLAADEARYLALLGRARMHVTGRFHGICLSLVTGTPFLTTGSNSWKIEALLADAGLPANRAIAETALPDLTAADLQRPFTPQESLGIAAFLARAHTETEALFADLAKLAGRGQT